MQQFRCTACGTVTTSSKTCPKCGRRSTIVPISGTESQADATAHNQPSRSKRDTRILFGTLLVAVISSITALILALGKFERKRPETVGKESSSALSEEASVQPRQQSQPRRFGGLSPNAPVKPETSTKPTICGVRYCLVTELEQRIIPLGKSSGKAGKTTAAEVAVTEGSLLTTHCFLTEKAPSEGRLWYVVLSHRIQWKQPGRPTEDILVVDNHTISLAPGADKWLGDLAGAFRTDRSPVGRRLFYLRRTRWGFSLGAPPSAPDPVTLQMALLAATASALLPAPPKTGLDEWTDDRPLMLPIRSPKRRWRRITKPSAKLQRWSIESQRPQQKSDGVSSSSHGPRVSLKGVAQAMDGHIDKVQIRWQTPRRKGRLLLIRKANGCLGDDDDAKGGPPAVSP